MKIPRITNEDLLFILAFSLGIGVRLLNLGAASLSDFEAQSALQALALSQGEAVALGPQPGYVMLTGLTFFIFGSANALARLWPAIAGSLLVAVPYFLRRELGSKPALVVAFGLALDPGLTAFSRLAGGPMLATGFGLTALTLWYLRRPIIAGVLAGLALLGGPDILHGILGVALALGLGWLLSKYEIINWFETGFQPPASNRARRMGMVAGLATIFFVGTMFFRYPQGLGAWVESLPAYLGGWLQDPELPALRVFAALVVYQPLGLIFGLVAAIRGWVRNIHLSRWLSLWALVALLLALFYPGRQMGNLGWVFVPLWILAGSELARHFRVPEERLAVLGQAILVTVLLVLAWINLAGLDLAAFDMQIYRLRWAVIAGVLVLIGITTGLVTLGWSRIVAQRGLSWGLGVTLGLFVFASLWRVSQLHANGENELLLPVPAVQQTDLLMDTLGDLAEFHTGRRDTLDMVVTAQRPSIRWALRNWKQARFANHVAVGELPSAVISTAEDSSPRFSVSYRGQDFAWFVYSDWQGALPQDWPSWLAFREAPQRSEQIILWVRGDVFPDGVLVSADGANESPGDEDSIDVPVE